LLTEDSTGTNWILPLNICASFCLASVWTDRFSAGKLSGSGDSGGGGLNIGFGCWP
jgi:hypothetical protein